MFGKRWNPSARHCFVTGGSQGLGLALALLLVQKGAHVSIVARNQERLDAALRQLEAARHNPDQLLTAHAFSLSEPEPAAEALAAAAAAHGGRCPDAVFLCAGTSTPGFWIEQDGASLRRGMDSSYWVQAYPALAATKRMVQDGVQGKIVFVSSVLGYASIVGYSTYSPGKHALRGLAETLRSELLLYNIGVHICFPATIYSPGYEQENLTKPEITLKIEETDGGQTPEQVARALLDGVSKGYFHIAPDLITNLFRTAALGATPRNNFWMEIIYGIIGLIGLPLWRRSVDAAVRKHRPEHQAYLRERHLVGADAAK